MNSRQGTKPSHTEKAQRSQDTVKNNWRKTFKLCVRLLKMHIFCCSKN